MALLPLAISLPADLREVHAGDVDRDGYDELVLVSFHERPRSRDAVSLTIVQLDEELATQRLDLGNDPLLWDLADGIVVLDGQGLAELSLDGARTRIASFPTALAGLGPTTPRKAALAHDLDDDGQRELVVWAGGRLQAFTRAGEALGSATAEGLGHLTASSSEHSFRLGVHASVPDATFVDVDGDGLRDVVFAQDTEARVHYSGPGRLAVRDQRLELPLDLDPRDDGALAKGGTEREIQATWLRDVDGDGRMDLTVMRSVREGSWFGSTSELLVYRGRPGGFAAVETRAFDAQAAEPFLLDADQDGDQDLVLPLVDVNVSNIVKGLVAKEITIAVYVLEMDGTFGEPRHVIDVDLGIDAGDSLLFELQEDLSGDGRPDLVLGTDDGIEVVASAGTGLEKQPRYRHAMTLPPDAQLLVHDFDRDGLGELLVWSRHDARATLLRVP